MMPSEEIGKMMKSKGEGDRGGNWGSREEGKLREGPISGGGVCIYEGSGKLQLICNQGRKLQGKTNR